MSLEETRQVQLKSEEYVPIKFNILGNRGVKRTVFIELCPSGVLENIKLP